MNISTIKSRLGVCSWSLQPADPESLVRQLLELGLPRMQLALDPLRDQPEIWGRLPDLCRQQGITIVSGMFGCVGEDYTTLESIRRTGGIVPDETWKQNQESLAPTAALAARLGLSLVTFHAGFMPHDPRDPAYQQLLDRLRQVVDVFAGRGITLAFETGQETAPTLRDCLQRLERANVGVNFDPANMILYDKGDPLEALRLLGPWLKQCHIKDAVKTRVAGTWGEEVPVGTGQVNWRAFFHTLQELNFGGYCCIEREAGQQRLADIRAACQHLEAFAGE